MGIIYKISIYFLCIITNRIAIRHYFRYTERSCCTTHLHEMEGFFLKKNILVGQSGGPTAVINASLYGIIKEAAAHSEQIRSVYGMINWHRGISLRTYYGSF